MFPFDVILFDVGGVLLTNGWDHRERATVVEHFHLDAEEFEARHAATFDAWERAAISGKAYWMQLSSMSRAVFLAAPFSPSSSSNPKRCPMGRWESLGRLPHPMSIWSAP